jgi:hypothetical protein
MSENYEHYKPYPSLEEQAEALMRKLVEPLNLDRWTVTLQTGALQEEQGRACCSASPEYLEATIAIDFDRLKTGDVLDEMVVHELTHTHVWPIHELAETLAQALAASAPAHLRDALDTLLRRQVEIAAETTTTSVAYVFLKLLRRAQILATPPVA